MASKRKSTIPCMIPFKSRPLQDALEPARRSPSIKEMFPCVIGDQTSVKCHRAPHEPTALDPGPDLRDNGTYTCKLCDLETPDLNLFLDHAYSGHPEFRSEPSFFCLDCGVGAAKFEGLALHNARVHPSTVTTVLQLKRKDRKFTVEQRVVAGPTESSVSKETEISITKAPIMKIMSRKSEPKKIVVSHCGVEEPVLPTAKQTDPPDPPAVTHVPTIVHNGSASKVTAPSAIQIVNGSGTLPTLKTGVTQVVSVVQNRGVTQHSSSTPSPSSKNLPKVMIPLSSIPTYHASMDGSSFLKTSFSKFPYPTKAELCYLTVVTKYPEEQIKIWFTAQRLKQGISWSPEEIEDARRKMFNTIIQTAPPAAQRQNQNQPTITVLPSIPHILQGNLLGQGGVIVTQPLISNGIQVSNAPLALAVTPKPQAGAKPMQAKPAAALAADKAVNMAVASVGSSNSGNATVISSTSSIISAVSSASATNQTSVISIGVSSSGKLKSTDITESTTKINNNISSTDGDHKEPPEVKTSTDRVSDITKTPKDLKENLDAPKNDGESKRSASPNVPASSSPATMDTMPTPSKSESPSLAVGASSRTVATPSLLDPSFFKAKKSQEQLSALKESFLVSQFPPQEEVERLISLTGLTVREVRKWFSDRRYHFRNTKSSKSGNGGQATSCGGSSANPAESLDNAAPPDRPKTPPQVPLSPSRAQHTTPPTPSRRHLRALSPDFTAVRYKEREPHQLRALESSFDQEPEPRQDEVDRLRTETKMTRREIHAWFSERRKRAAAQKKREELERAEREAEEKERDDGKEKVPEDATPEAMESKDDLEDGAELKVNPIKINLKMLKVCGRTLNLITSQMWFRICKDFCLLQVTEAEGSPPPAESRKAPSPVPQTSQSRTKKTPDQLHVLKQAFARTHWPSSPLYNELITRTGLPRAEVVRWFGDCRYVLKNGQLKWLESYQAMAEDEELDRADVTVLQEHLKTNGRLLEDQRGALARSSGLTEELVCRWFGRQAEASASTVTAAIESVLRGADDGGGGGVAEEQPAERTEGETGEERGEARC